jgi:hypothetical protein
VPVQRRPDCVGCGDRQGQENLRVMIPEAEEATVLNLFQALQGKKVPVTEGGWMITNPLNKNFIYNPQFPKGKTQLEKLASFNVGNLSEVTFTPFGQAAEGIEIKQFNVIIEFPATE